MKRKDLYEFIRQEIINELSLKLINEKKLSNADLHQASTRLQCLGFNDEISGLLTEYEN